MRWLSYSVQGSGCTCWRMRDRDRMTDRQTETSKKERLRQTETSKTERERESAASSVRLKRALVFVSNQSCGEKAILSPITWYVMPPTCFTIIHASSSQLPVFVYNQSCGEKAILSSITWYLMPSTCFTIIHASPSQPPRPDQGETSNHETASVAARPLVTVHVLYM